MCLCTSAETLMLFHSRVPPVVYLGWSEHWKNALWTGIGCVVASERYISGFVLFLYFGKKEVIVVLSLSLSLGSLQLVLLFLTNLRSYFKNTVCIGNELKKVDGAKTSHKTSQQMKWAHTLIDLLSDIGIDLWLHYIFPFCWLFLSLSKG